MLKLEIGGRWEPHDFVEIFRSVESFYYKLALARFRDRYDLPFWFQDDYQSWTFSRFDGLPFEVALDRINERMLERARYQTPARLRLNVVRIQYASPGGIDLLGVGKVIETVADSIGRMKSYYDDAPLRRERDRQATLETELKHLQIEQERENLQALKIKNAENALRVLETRPELRDALLPLLVRDQDAIATRIADQKLIAAEVTDGDREEG
jgi:hypothetical protein